MNLYYGDRPIAILFTTSNSSHQDAPPRSSSTRPQFPACGNRPSSQQRFLSQNGQSRFVPGLNRGNCGMMPSCRHFPVSVVPRTTVPFWLSDTRMTLPSQFAAIMRHGGVTHNRRGTLPRLYASAVPARAEHRCETSTATDELGEHRRWRRQRTKPQKAVARLGRPWGTP